ncbi:type IV pilus modification PilV family protein [Verrucomicrobiota bacterium sgz303538]
MQSLLSQRLAQGLSNHLLAGATFGAGVISPCRGARTAMAKKPSALSRNDRAGRMRTSMQRKPSAGFALIESLMGMVLVSLMLSCVFAMNSQVLSLLKQGKESTYATQMLQERVEQLRTSLWDEVTDPAKLTNILTPATATSVNLSGVTETIKVEPLVNPGGVSIVCVRSPSGTVTASGTAAAFANEKTVKVSMSVQWASRSRVRERGMVTVLSNGGI